MGIYINPKDCAKEQWLAKYRDTVTRAPPTSHIEGDRMAVVLVDNEGFTAAGIAFSPSELAAFSRPDLRPKLWFMVPIADLEAITGVSLREYVK